MIIGVFTVLLVHNQLFFLNNLFQIILKLKTPLQWAAWKGNKNIVLTLLENGADRNIESNSRQVALDYAKQENHSGVVSLLGILISHLFFKVYLILRELDT